jgi:hypothetical protein
MAVFDWLTGRRSKTTSRPAPAMSTEEAIDAVTKLGQLMERHPLALLDTKRLPLPKPDMKAALKIAWRIAPSDELRRATEHAYLHLSSFQDGVGDEPIDPTLSAGATPEESRAILDPYVGRSAQVQAESGTLLTELTEFKLLMKPR